MFSHQITRAQEFITQWDLNGSEWLENSGPNQLEFNVQIGPGGATYLWEELSPGNATGQGVIPEGSGPFLLTGLPEGAVFRLKIAPVNLLAFSIAEGPDRGRLTLVEQWGSASWITMERAFDGCEELDVVATDVPDLSNVTSMHAMFRYTRLVNGSLNDWDVSNVEDMSFLFNNAFYFNQPLNDWNTSAVTDMRFLFSGCYSFNQPMGNWNTSAVEDFTNMFEYASVFNQPIGNWNTGSAKSMAGMFRNTFAFNQPIGNWNTSIVEDFSYMFSGAFAFNQPIGSWNTGSAEDMSYMFASAFAFNQPIGQWNTENVVNMSYMFFSNFVFNQAIGNWNTVHVVNMQGMFSSNSGFNQPIGNWDTGNVLDMSYMFNVTTAFNQPIGSWNTENVINMSSMFRSSNRFNQPIDSWNTGNVHNMSNMFAFASAFNQSINQWNTGNVADMSYMFMSNSSFNQPIGDWNTGNVVTMEGMFSFNTVFNQRIDSWNTANVENMSKMFESSTYNQPLEAWNTGKVTTMEEMFKRARSFNQALNAWNTSSVTSFRSMFESASVFNQDLSNWNTENVISLQAMFIDSGFNQPLESWNVSNVLTFKEMLTWTQTSPFNQPLGKWVFHPDADIGAFMYRTSLSCENYTATLMGWCANNPGLVNKSLSVLYRQYGNNAIAARNKLINEQGWIIHGDVPSGTYCYCDIVIDELNITQESCQGSSDGSVVVSASCLSCSGGTEDIRYSIDGVNFQPENTFTGLTSGSYTISVRDVNHVSCLDTEVATVSTGQGLSAPDISCPGAIIASADSGICESVIQYAEPIGSHPCENVNTEQVSGFPSGASFPVGSTTNVYKVTAANGLTATCSFTVTVEDQEPPSLEVPTTGLDLGFNPPFLPTLDDVLLLCATSDNCDPGPITGDAGDVIVDGSNRSQTFTITATDGWNNATTLSVTYTWSVAAGPVLENVPVGGYLGCNPATLPACDNSVTASSECGPVDVTCTPGVIVEDGCDRSQTFTYTATACDLTTSAEVTYMWKEDTQAPILTVPAASINLGCNPVLPTIADAMEVSSATDNCGTPTITVVETSVSGGACFKAQVFVVTATDLCGNQDTKTVVYVWTEDLVPPALGVPTSGLDLGCNPTVLPTLNTVLLSSGTSDNCVPGPITGVAGDVLVNGCERSQTFTITASDGCGNATTLPVTYTWSITTGLVLENVPSGGSLGCNPATLPACDNSVTASSECGPANVTCTPGVIVEDGCERTQTFTYTATACDLTTSAEVTYSWKEDTQSPVLTVPAASINLGYNPTLPTVDDAKGVSSAMDNCGTPDISAVANAISGEACFKAQVFIVTATDDCGNQDTNMVEYVWTEDLTPPSLDCPANITMTNDPMMCSAAVEFDSPQGSDNCPGFSVAQISGLASGSQFPAGTSTVIFQITAANQETATCQFQITVVDAEQPVLICPEDAQVSMSSPTTWLVPDFTEELEYSDNCGIALIEQSLTSGSQQPTSHGETHQITLIATDHSGLSSTCVFIVTTFFAEGDIEIACPENITVSAPACACDIPVFFEPEVLADGPYVLNYSHDPGTAFSAGTTAVTITATDIQNQQTASCQFEITVEEHTRIQLTGNAIDIANGDMVPSLEDHTYFGFLSLQGSRTRTFTINHTGCAPLDLTGTPMIIVEGVNASFFDVVVAPVESTIENCGSLSFQVRYTGLAYGVHEAIIRIPNNAPGQDPYIFAISGATSDAIIQLRGNGVPIENGDSTPVLNDFTDFGTINFNSNRVRQFAVWNLGVQNLILTGNPRVQITGENANKFTVTVQPGSPIPGGAHRLFSVRFDATEVGEFSAWVNISSNDMSNEVYSFAIKGTVLPPDMRMTGNNQTILNGSTEPLAQNLTDFGSRAIGSSTTNNFYVRNDAGGILALLGSPRVQITGPGAAMFTVTTQPAATVAVGSSSLLRIRYVPLSAGTHEATVVIPSNDPTKNPHTFAIRGATPGAALPYGGEPWVIDRFATEDLKLSAYPNPVNEQLFIEAPASKDAYRLEIMNLEGRVVYSAETLGGRLELQAGSWMPGMYIIRAHGIEVAPIRFIKIE